MGYETPVEMPSMGIYNTDLMKMYIAGVKDQYEKGQEEMKDFMKLYGDFYSPVPGATEAYNRMTIGGANDMINQMLANGIDPYKSPEARAAISRYIASVPTGTLNVMKRSAENAKEYKKNRDKLILAGQYDPEFERFMLGGKTLEEWDPTTPFTATTPHTKQDWETFTTPYFKNFKAQEYLGPSRPGYALYGTKPEEIQKATNASYNDLQNSPWGKYQIDKAQRQVENMTNSDGTPLTQKQKQQVVEQILRGNIQDAATHYFQPKEEEDSWYQTLYKIANDNHQKALDRAQDDRHFNILHGGDRNDGEGNTKNPQGHSTLSEQYITEANAKANKEFADFQSSVLTTFIDKASSYREKHPNNHIKSKKQSTDWWHRAFNDPQKYGLVDKNGKKTNLLKRWETITGVTLDDNTTIKQYEQSNDLLRKFSGKRVGNIELSNAADKMYSKYTTRPTNSKELTVINDALTGSAEKQTIMGESGKYRVFQSDNTIQYTPIRRATLFNGKSLLSKVASNFNTWLQNKAISLTLRNTNTKVAAIPKSNGGRSLDIYGRADVKMKDFKDFIRFSENLSSNKDVSDDLVKYYLKALGLQVFNTRNEKADYDDVNKKFIANYMEYVRIPITKTLNDNESYSYELSRFDDAYERLTHGQNAAEKKAVSSEMHALGQ